MTAPRLCKWIPALLVAASIGLASAKLPPPPVDPEKAAEAKAKAALAAKEAGALLEKYMDRAVERYKLEKGSRAGASPAEKKP